MSVIAIEFSNKQIRNKIRLDDIDGIPVSTLTLCRGRSDLAIIGMMLRLSGSIRLLGSLLKHYYQLKRRCGHVDFIHAYDSSSRGLFAFLASAITGSPYIITERVAIHLLWSKDVNSRISYRTKMKLLLLRFILRKAKAVFLPSVWLKEKLCEVAAKPDNCIVLPDAIEIRTTHQRTLSDNIYILTVCKLWDRIKNVSGVMRMFARLRKKYANIEFHIVGDGADRLPLELYADRLHLLNAGIYFHGYVNNDQLGDYFSKANFFVLNSRFETFSVAAVEAIAHGVPVVVSPCGGPQEIVSPDVGIVAREMTDDGLYDAMEYMIAHWNDYDPEILMNYARNNFDIETIGARAHKIYVGLLHTSDSYDILPPSIR